MTCSFAGERNEQLISCWKDGRFGCSPEAIFRPEHHTWRSSSRASLFDFRLSGEVYHPAQAFAAASTLVSTCGHPLSAMFFANGYAESERRQTSCTSDETDILRELLLDGEFTSPRHLVLTPAKQQGHNISLLSKRPHVDISLPQICLESSPHFTRLQPLSARSCANFSLPAQSPVPVCIVNSIVSPPRGFIQDFSRLPPFFNEGPTPSPLHELADHAASKAPKATASVPFLTSCLPPPPLPMLTMPPTKKRRTTSQATPTPTTARPSSLAERKQLRCSYPDCPNLRRSAGFCNRHSGKVCNVDGCHKSALSRGKCPEHGGGSRCKKDGCSKFAQTRGLCKSHGGGRQCKINGCTKNAHQNRLCRSHGGGKRCDYQGCPKWAQRSGFCCAHTKLGREANAAAAATNAAPRPLVIPVCPTMPMLPMPSPLPALNSTAPASSPMLLSPHRLMSLLP